MKIFKITLIERDGNDRRKIIDANQPSNLKEVLDLLNSISDPEFSFSMLGHHLIIENRSPDFFDEGDWRKYKIRSPFYIDAIIHGPKRAIKRLEKVWRASNE